MPPGILSPMGTHRHPYSSHGSGAAPSVTVSLAFKRAKLLCLALVAIGVVAASVVFFRGGVTIATVQLPTVKTEVNEKEREKLLNDYNSNTGNAAAALTKPIEVFATMVLQLVLLQPELSWRLDKFSACAAWALLYLLLNGFNSLNVQLRSKRVVAVITASDLSNAVATERTASTASLASVAMDTTASVVVPETTPGNLVTNTVLRTAVVPRVLQMPPTTCTNSRSRIADSQVKEVVAADGVEFGFPIRAWNAKMLPAAPPTKQLTISLASNTTDVNPSDLPMSVYRASKLYAAGMSEANKLLTWFDVDVVGSSEKEARGSGRFPLTKGTEEADLEWFVRELPKRTNERFRAPKPDLFDVDENQNPIRYIKINDTETGLHANGSTSTSRFSEWDDMEDACGPEPATICMVEKQQYGDNPIMYDFPSQVLALRVCDETDPFRMLYGEDCVKSNTSMLVLSVAKTFTADSVKTSRYPLPDYNRIFNPRKVYAFTAGLLTCQTQDLAMAFGATCAVDGGCDGLQFPLTSKDQASSSANEVLVASTNAVPIQSLQLAADAYKATNYTQLVLLREPMKPGMRARDTYFNISTGDVMLPHNIRDGISANNPTVGLCSPMIENRLNGLLSGVPKTVVTTANEATSAGTAPTMATAGATLQFDGNRQETALVASIPETNVWLSLAGCVVLAIGVLATVTDAGQLIEEDTTAAGVLYPATEDATKLNAVANVSDPRVIAQVMLDDSRFPPMFLDRKVVDTSGRLGITKMTSFQISSMTLESEHVDGSKETVTANNTAMDAGLP